MAAAAVLGGFTLPAVSATERAPTGGVDLSPAPGAGPAVSPTAAAAPPPGALAAMAEDPEASTASAPIWETGNVTASIPLGVGATDVVYDSGNGDLYVSDEFANEVTVINAATYAIVTTIHVQSEPMEAAYDSANGQIWLANEGSGNVSVISTSTNTVVEVLVVGSTSQPYGMAYDSSNGDVYVAESNAGSVDVIRASTYTPVATIPLGGGTDPFRMAYDAGNGDVYVACFGNNQVYVINGATNTVTTHFGVGNEPVDVAYDSTNGDLYVPDEGSSSVNVINGATNSVVATVVVPSTPQGVAYDGGNGDVYVVENVAGADVSVINGVSNSVVASITAGSVPKAAAYDSANGNVYVPNFDSDSVSVISTLLLLDGGNPYLRGLGEPGTSSGSVAVKSDPWDVAFDSGDDDLYVSNFGSADVTVFSQATNAVVATVSVGNGPTFLAYDSGNGNVYVPCYGTDLVYVISGASNTVITTVPVGTEPYAAAYDSANGDLYVTNVVTNNVSVINGATDTPVGSVAVGVDPLGLAYDSGNGNVYVANSDSNNLSVISGASNRLIPTIPVGTFPEDVAYDSTSGNVYVSDYGARNVSVVSGATDSVLKTIPVGTSPFGVGYDTGNGNVYVANDGSLNVSVISGTTNKVVGTLSAGTEPTGLAYDSANGNVYVSNLASGNVTVIPTLVASTVPEDNYLDVGQSLLISAPVDGEGTGDLEMTILSSTSASLSCSSDPLGQTEISGACLGLAAGTFTVTLTLTDSLGNSVQTSLSVRVLSAPTLSVATAVPSTLDVGQSTILSTSASGGTRAYVYNWTGLPTGCVPEVSAELACTPTGPGTSHVNVTAIDTDGYPMIAGPTLVVVSPDPAVGVPVATPASVDVGESTTLTGAVVNPGSGSDVYAWAGLPGGCHSANSLTIVCVPSSSGTFSVVLSIQDSNGMNVSAPPLTLVVSSSEGVPTLSASVSALDVGQSVTLTSSVSGGSGVYTFSWSGLPTGCESSNSLILVCAPTASGTFPVVVSAEDSNGVEQSSVPLPLVVSPPLVTPTVAVTASTLDVGQTVDLSASVSGGSGGYLFTWSGLPIGCASADEATIACTPISPAGAFSVVVSVEDSNGMNLSSFPVTLVVSPVEGVPTLSASESALDIGQSVSLTGSVSGGSGAYTFSWAGLPGGCESANSLTVVCAPSSAGTFRVVFSAQDSNGVNLSSSPLKLVVSSALATPTLTSSVSLLDVGQSVTLSATASGGADAYTYSWSGLPGGCTSANSPSIVCTPTGSGTYAVTVNVLDSNGVSLSSSPESLVVSPALGTPSVSASSTVLDVGQLVNVSAKVTGGSGGNTYSWSGIPTGCQAADSLTFSCSPSAAGTFAVALHIRDSNGANASSTPLTLTVSPALETPSVTSSLPTVSVGQTVFFTATVSGGSGVYTYTWTGLPSGCGSVDAATLACTPNNAASGSLFSVFVTVRDSNGVSLTSSASSLTVTTASVPSSSSSGISSTDALALGLALVALLLGIVALVLALRRKGGSGDQEPPSEPPETPVPVASPAEPQPAVEVWNEDVETPSNPPGQ